MYDKAGGAQSIYSSVTQPSEASFTLLIYLYSVPRVALYGGMVQCAWRRAISSSLTATSRMFCSASMVMTSPS